MRWLRAIILIMVVALVQIGLMSALRIAGIVPNSVLALMVGLVAWGTASEALLAAVVAGLMMDVSSGGTFGLAVSCLVVIVLGLVAIRQLGVDGQTWPSRVFMAAIATTAWWAIHIVSLGFVMVGSWAAWRILIIEILINAVLATIATERVVRGTRKV